MNDHLKIFDVAVEHLTDKNWRNDIMPYLKGRELSAQIRVFYYVDGTEGGISEAKLFCEKNQIAFERLDFSFVQVKDEKGDGEWLNVHGNDMLKVLSKIASRADFRRTVENYPSNTFYSYLLKKVIGWTNECHNEICKTIFVAKVVLSKTRGSGRKNMLILFVKQMLWSEEVAEYLIQDNVTVVLVGKIDLKVKKDAIRSNCIWMAKKLVYALRMAKFCIKKTLTGRINDLENRISQWPKRNRIMVQYYSCLNLESPHLFSDLFFLQQSGLPAENVSVSFHMRKDPLDEEKSKELKNRGLSAVGLSSLAVLVPNIPVYDFRMSLVQKGLSGGTAEEKWLKKASNSYRDQLRHWMDVFTKEGVKLFVSWYRYDEQHCIIGDALRNVGGVSVIYQRSLDYMPSPWYLTDVDVMFGYSSEGVETLQKVGSKISYYVVTGYLGDHRFELSRAVAQDVRLRLQKAGAQKIIAYFDENSAQDGRWSLSHQDTEKNYIFLLTKLMEDPSLGLIIKPKAYSTLLKRLGNTAELINKAVKTGRCFIFEGGTVQSSCPPAAAALGADIVIHSALHAGTAGMESALAGRPTLLLDCEGFSESPLYRLGEGKVVFKTWEHLWNTLTDAWKSPQGLSGLGDWSKMIHEFDPFRDGRAAERMGTYLQWLLEGFNAGLSRDIVLANAATRYQEKWGKDKVFAINGENKDSLQLNIRGEKLHGAANTVSS